MPYSNFRIQIKKRLSDIEKIIFRYFNNRQKAVSICCYSYG